MKKTMVILHSVFYLLFMLSCDSDDQPDMPSADDGTPVNLPDGEFTSAKEAKDSNGNVYSIGFDQVSSKNQDPFIEKTNSEGETIWRLRYEETPVDGRGEIIAFLKDRLWAVFTVDGGSNNSEYINKHQIEGGAFSGVYLSGYGRGGGAKVSILCEINPETGKIIKGSFIRAQLENGKTNSKSIAQIGWNESQIAARVVAAAWPAGTGTSYNRMEGVTNNDRIDGFFYLYYELEPDLTEVKVAELLRDKF